MKNVEETIKELIEKVKTQTTELWNTIQEAKKSNIEVTVGLDNIYIEPIIKITKVLY